MEGVTRQARRAGAEATRGGTARPAPWRRATVLAALMLAAFTLNTVESLPVGLLEPVATGLGVSVPAAGLLVTRYGMTVAVASVPLAHALRSVPRRHVLAGLLTALVVSSVVSALAPSYGVLLAGRLTAALAQALFWAVMGPVAVGLFAPEVRGRVVGALSVAGSLALVLGVPAAAWLGRLGGWRLPFALPAVPGLVCLVTIAALLPVSRPEEEPAAYAAGPDARRFKAVLAAGFLSATGAFAGYTYLVAFLDRVSGFAPAAVGVLLSVFGAACLAGVGVTAVALDRFPRPALTAAVTVQTVGMLGLYAAGDRPAAAVLFLVLTGGALRPVFMAAQHAMLDCAPGRTDLALAANSGCYNAGIAAGAALGALILSHAGPRGVFLAGGLLTASAGVVLLGGHLPRRRPAGRAGAAPRRAARPGRCRGGTRGHRRCMDVLRSSARAADSRPMAVAARAGFAARGLLYVLVAVIALRIALGVPAASGRPTGAARSVSWPGGRSGWHCCGSSASHWPGWPCGGCRRRCSAPRAPTVPRSAGGWRPCSVACSTVSSRTRCSPTRPGTGAAAVARPTGRPTM